MPVFVLMMYLAFFFYTVAIWSEQGLGRLRRWMLTVFLAGFVCDLTGTLKMMRLAEGSMGIHGSLGTLALFIMLVHLIWAVATLFAKNSRAQELFHAHSWKAWFVWMVAFISGAATR